MRPFKTLLLLYCLPPLLTILLIILVIPISVLVYFPFFIYRQIVILIAQIVKKESLARILTTRSSLFLSDKIYSDPRLCIISLLVVEGSVDVTKLRATFLKKVLDLVDPTTGRLKYPELRQSVEYFFGFPFWRKLNDKFDLNELIYLHHHDDNDKTTTSSKDAFNVMNKLSFKPFSENKPLWEIIVLQNFIPDPDIHSGISGQDSSTYSGIIIRCQHGLADGYCQLRLIQALSDNSYNFNFITPTANYCHKNKDEETSSTCYRVLNNLTCLFKIPFTISQMMTKRLVLLSSWTELNKVSNNLSRSRRDDDEDNRLTSHHSINFSLSEISKIKQRHGVTGTSVLYSAVVGATRTIFTKLPQMPEHVLIVTPLPLPGVSGKLRNHITVGTITVPLAEPDPIKRLEKMNKNLSSLKHSMIPTIHSIFMQIAGSVPSFLLRFFVKLKRENSNFILISNLPGPTTGETDFCSYPIKDFLVNSGAAIETKILTVSLLSISGKIRMSVATDKSLLNYGQSKEFIQNFFNELEILKNSVNYKDQTV